MSDKLTQNLTELTSVDTTNDKIPIADASDTAELKYATPDNIIPTASDTVKGKVELATTAETTTGTDATRAVTPDGLHDMTSLSGAAWFLDEDTMTSNSDTKVPSQQSVKAYVDAQGGDTAPPNLLKNGNFINNSTNGYGSTPDDWTSSNANPVQGGIPALTKQNLIDGLGIADGDIEGLWPLNEASGNALDLSSNAYNLTDTNTVETSSDGLMASARDFELANSEYFTIADASAPNLEISGSQTWLCFVKPESLNGGDCFMGKSSGVNYNLLQLTSGSVVQFQLLGLTTNSTISSDVVLQAGKWHMIVGVYDSANSKLKVWVNGIKKEVTASGTHTDSNATFNLGRTGGTSNNYYDGLMQNAAVLSVALTDNQVKKLFAMTMYKGQKIRRATTNAYIYQQLPQDLVERLRGKTVALRADLYQEVASTAQISIHQTMADATTDETIISATDATTGSWLSKVATGTLEADVVTVEIRIKHSTTDGNTWFRRVSLYEGSTSLPYDHSKDDWSRFPRLLQMSIPSFYLAFPYQYEENRWFDGTPTVTSGSGTPTTVTKNDYVWMFRSKQATVNADITVTAKGTAASTVIVPLPILSGSTGTFTSCGRETAATGKLFGTTITTGANNMSLLDYLNATLWVDTYRLPACINYEID